MLANCTYYSTNPVHFYEGYDGIDILPPHFKFFDHFGSPIEFPVKENGWRLVIPYAQIMRCPSDPTLCSFETHGIAKEYTSYPYNAMVYVSHTRFPESILDGCSNTIAFSERYGITPGSRLMWTVCDTPKIQNSIQIQRPSTFADYRYSDNLPINDPVTKVCLGSRTGVSFLNQVPPTKAVEGELISGHSGMIQTGFLDGSVRIVSQSISPSVFWAQVTPNAAD